MSLILRQQAQPLLDACDLHNFHVGVGSNKQLVILSECGKTLLHVHGIQFSKTIPSNAEIAYAIELLELFIIKHKKAIEDYIKASNKFKQLSKPEMPKDVHINYNNKFIEYTEGVFRVELNADGELTSLAMSAAREPMPFPKNGVIRLDMTRYDEVITYFKDYLAYQELQNNLEDMASEISKCDI